MKVNKKYLGILIIIMEGIPLLIYPFVLLANLMTLAGHSTGDESIFLMIIVKFFVVMSSSYPLTYIFCLIHYFNKRRNGYRITWLTFLPLVHIIIVIILGNFWAILT